MSIAYIFPRELLAIYVLDEFMLLMIPRLENAEMLILCAIIILK